MLRWLVINSNDAFKTDWSNCAYIEWRSWWVWL